MTTTTSNLSHPKYRPDIDGLRAIAVLAVVIFHAFPDLLRGGFIGVDIFFVISGYLISTIIFQNLDNGTFSFLEFYARRIKRIFPALILVLIVCLGFGWFNLLADEMNQLGKHVAAGAIFISNFVLWGEAGYFDTAADYKPLLHLWSLGIEEQFYIVWPLLLWLIWKRKSSLLFIIGILITISFSLNMLGIKQDPTATFYSPQTRFWELLFGSLLAYFTLYKSVNLSKGQSNTNISNLVSVLGVLFLLIGFSVITKEKSFPGYWALIPVIGSVLIILAGPNSWLNQNILSNKILVWFGLISFPLYLWHWPILSFARIANEDIPKTKVRFIAVIASILLAWITVKFLEKPIRYGNNNKLKIILLYSCLGITGLTGFIVYKTDLSKSHGYENLLLKRKSEHLIGKSFAWYEGKDNWLFLGNAHDQSVSKLKLSSKPEQKDIIKIVEQFTKIAQTAKQFDTQVVLIIGPNKTSVYPEFLPDSVKASDTKYVSFFLDELNKIPNLLVYDPTQDLIGWKQNEGLLYWRTDTHWNDKGAFLVFSKILEKLKLPIPNVQFENSGTHHGDLIDIGKLTNYPISKGDNWKIAWDVPPNWSEQEIKSEKNTPFGLPSIVTNPNALSNNSVWVVGDSFANKLKPYFNNEFSQIFYAGHWGDKLDQLSDNLKSADIKPNIIFIIRVERSF